MNVMFYIFIFVFGLIFGSFCNVIIYRIPRRESIVFPSSHCPDCGAKIKPYDNIPIISYIILHGRCRNCHKKISVRYPIIELSVGIIFLINFYYFGISVLFFKYLFFSISLFIISMIDSFNMVIPDIISIPSIFIGLIFNFFIYIYDLMMFVKVFVLGAIIGMFIIAFIKVAGKIIWKKEVMGSGDILLMGIIGSFLGIYAIIPTLFWGSFLGAIIGGILMLAKKANRGSLIPFGPYLSVGSIIAIFTLPYIFKIFGLN